MTARLFMALLLSGLAFSSAWADFLPADEAFKLSLSETDQGLEASWEIAPGYYLYQHQFVVDTAGGSLELTDLPEGVPIEDEFFGESVAYYDQVSITIPTQGDPPLTLSWQGCAEQGLCYPPQTIALADAPASDQALPGSADQQLSERLSNAGLFWVISAFFGMGLLLTFTPCVLPMVPILSTLIVNDGGQGKTSTARGLALSVAFVIPMALTYALLGVLAAMAGTNLQMALQQPAVIYSVSIVFVLLALAMFGAFNLELPTPLRDRLDSLMRRTPGGRFSGAMVMGILSALLVGPCMTAPLAGALLYIADTGNAWVGGTSLLALGLGMGAPLLLVGALGPQLLPKPGAWMVRVRGLFGFVLLGLALWFAERALPGTVVLWLWGALLVLLATTLYRTASLNAADAPASLWQPFTGAVAVLAFIWGGFMLAGAAAGYDRPLQPLGFLQSPAGSPQQQQEPLFQPVTDLDDFNRALNDAAANNQWTFVDFTADWCVSCKVMERDVFARADVREALSGFQRLQPDVTANTAADQALMQHLQVIGPPTLLFIDPAGNEYRSARITGEITHADFLAHLSALPQ
ncbi:MAG: protein-disulfide reductase DsbD [Halomonadaceae bacterium]|nr:MAG: protein-disulfide reductase DsbD [Halomonadaceae bacterium]